MMTSLWRAIQADRSPPGYAFGTTRAVAPSETLRRIRPLLRAAGITRLADITGLDWIGIPVYQAVRPNSRILSVAQGKGLTRAQAQVSALMEALEGFHAEEIVQPGERETVGAMRRALAYDPRALPLEAPDCLPDDLPLAWVAATDLSTGAPTWVPRELCELDFRVEERYFVPRFRTSTNGLASGNTVAEAVLHGLCEVVERDSFRRNEHARLDPRRRIAAETVEPWLARRLLDRVAQAGMETEIVDLSGPTGLPCFQVWLDHPEGPTAARGEGCHPSRLTALLRALTEAAQSRLTYIAGNRDDIDRRIYRRPGARTDGTGRAAGEPRGRFADAPTLRPTDFGAQVREIVARVRSVTGMSPVAVDLWRADFDLPVVFVVAPGLDIPREL